MSTLKVGEIKHESFTGTTQLKLDSAGRLLVGTDTKGQADADDFTVANSGSGGITIRTGNSNNANIFFSDATSGSAEYAGYLQYKHDHDRLDFGTATSTRMTIDSSGRLLLGTTSSTGTGVGNSRLQISGTGADTAGLNLIRTSNDGGGAYLQFTKNRGGATQSGDNCGAIAWMGHDGTDVNSYLATIKVEAGATATSNTMRGDIIFETADGGSVSSERMRIDSSGNVGIGMTTVGAALDINGASGDTLRLSNGSALYQYRIGRNSADGKLEFYGTQSGDVAYTFGGVNGERMRINSDGDVLIGRTSTIDTSEVLGIKGPSGDNCTFGITNDGTTQSGIIAFNDDDATFRGRIQYNHNGDSMVFHTAGVEQMRITSNGFLKAKGDCANYQSTTGNYHELMHDTGGHTILDMQHNSSNGFGVVMKFNHGSSSNYAVKVYNFASGSSNMYVRTDGDLENINNSYGGTSDIKLKENIVDAKSQWDDIKALKVRNFNYKADENKTKFLGLVAQEAETVCPSLVKDQPDLDEDNKDLGTKTKVLKYSILYMKAVKALQEAQARIETLETKVAALEAK